MNPGLISPLLIMLPVRKIVRPAMVKVESQGTPCPKEDTIADFTLTFLAFSNRSPYLGGGEGGGWVGGWVSGWVEVLLGEWVGG